MLQKQILSILINDTGRILKTFITKDASSVYDSLKEFNGNEIIGNICASGPGAITPVDILSIRRYDV